MRYDTHICLVSDQSLANLLPVFLERFQPKNVVLLVTPAMRSRALILEQNLRTRGCSVSTCEVQAYGFEAIREASLQLVSDLAGSLAINLTGGTKVMVLAAFDVARHFEIPVFYLDSRDQRIIHLYPDIEDIQLPEILNVKAAFRAQGYDIVERGTQQIPRQHGLLTTQLVSNAEKLAKALSALNYIAAKAKNKLTLPVDIQRIKEQVVLDEVIDLFQQAGLLAVDRGQILFRDENARFYANGGWLEEHCLGVAQKLRKAGRIADLEPNAKISSQGVSNEIDLAFTARNQLHIIECKTADLSRFSKERPAETRAIEAGYRLDTLRDLVGGTFGKAMLVSYLKLPEIDRIRCESYGIKVVQVRQLRRLDEELIQRIGGRIIL